MTRLGITFEEVELTAEKILSEGENPTIERIRSLLGTGSNSTISKHLQRWRQRTPSPALSTPPDIVKAAVDRVWEEMREQTKQQIESIKTETQGLVEKAESRAQTAEIHSEGLTKSLEQLQATYLTERAEKELLLLDIKKLREEHTLLAEKYHGLEQRYRDLQTLSTKHTQDLISSHQEALQQIKASHEQQIEQVTKSIALLKDQYETERQQYLVVQDSLRVENKKWFNHTEELKTQLQDKKIRIKELEGQLLNRTNECDLLTKQLNNIEEKWSVFNDKMLVSNTVINKIMDSHAQEALLQQLITHLSVQLNHQFQELKKHLKFDECIELLTKTNKEVDHEGR